MSTVESHCRTIAQCRLSGILRGLAGPHCCVPTQLPVAWSLEKVSAASSAGWVLHARLLPCCLLCTHNTIHLASGKSDILLFRLTSDSLRTCCLLHAQEHGNPAVCYLAQITRSSTPPHPQVADMEKRLASALQVADLPQLQAQLSSLENDAGATDLWDDAARAQQLMTRLNNMRSEVQQLQAFQGLLEEAAFAIELLEAEVRGRQGRAGRAGQGRQACPADAPWRSGRHKPATATRLLCAASTFSCRHVAPNTPTPAAAIHLSTCLPQDSSEAEQASIIREALQTLAGLGARLDKWELQRLLSGPYDERGARLTLSAGAGGVDAMDWSEMLERMYIRWGCLPAGAGRQVASAGRSAACTGGWVVCRRDAGPLR
jgi:hypothetical protein